MDSFLTRISGWFLRALTIAWLSLPVVHGDDLLKLPPETRYAHVVIVKDSAATTTFEPRLECVRAMVDRGVLLLTGKTNLLSAWRSLVSTQDIIGIKVDSVPGPTSGTRPAVVVAVVQGLFQAGVPPDHIILWDKRMEDLRRAGYVSLAKRLDIRAAGSVDEGYDETTFYERALLGSLIWGDSQFGEKGPGIGRKSFVSKLITKQLTKIINISPLISQSLAGVTGNLYGLVSSSVDNFHRFETVPSQFVEVVPEIYALPALGDRVALNIVDALICQYQGEQHSLLQYSIPLNQLRFSKDPVALDVLSVQELDRQRQAARISGPKPNFELYQNAAVLDLGFCNQQQFLVETARLDALEMDGEKNQTFRRASNGILP